MESSDEEDDMLTIKRKDHEIQDEDGKFLSKKTPFSIIIQFD